MLSFSAYSNGQPADRVDLTGAYVVGSDDVPLRADISFDAGIIHCNKRSTGPAGLALLCDLPEVGNLLLETVRLPERDKPYVLSIELARGRLVRISQKIEDWGLLQYPGTEPIHEEIAKARDLLIKAIQSDSPAEASAWGDQSLVAATKASEALARFHTNVFFDRRKQSGGFGKRVLGASIRLNDPADLARTRLLGIFDFVTIPINWRQIEPSEQTFDWKPLDTWVETIAKLKIPMKGSALLSFAESCIPDWLYIWEHDFDTIRDLAFEHARRVLNRYGQYIQSWDVISGIHAHNCFSFNFEQLMELTRMTAALAKQVQPRGTAIIDIVAPWGEYYARNQRTIPPLLYADMVSQSGINFDAFGLQLFLGNATDGMFVRDMFQISSLLDLFGKMNKPVHITAVQVPSNTTPPTGNDPAQTRTVDGGTWRQPWSETIQEQWFEQFMQLALSKPFIESVAWHQLVDHFDQTVLHGGLLNSDLTPKAAYQRIKQLRTTWAGQSK